MKARNDAVKTKIWNEYAQQVALIQDYIDAGQPTFQEQIDQLFNRDETTLAPEKVFELLRDTE